MHDFKTIASKAQLLEFFRGVSKVARFMSGDVMLQFGDSFDESLNDNSVLMHVGFHTGNTLPNMYEINILKESDDGPLVIQEYAFDSFEDVDLNEIWELAELNKDVSGGITWN